MKEIIIQIPDAKAEFLLELLDQLGVGFQVGKMQKQEDEMIIPEFHKTIVRERIKRYTDDPKRILKWNEVRNNFKFA